MKASEVVVSAKLFSSFKRDGGMETMKKAGQTLLLALSLLLLVSATAAAQERQTPYIYALSNPVVVPYNQSS